jgi:hypothetical protein
MHYAPRPHAPHARMHHTPARTTRPHAPHARAHHTLHTPHALRLPPRAGEDYEDEDDLDDWGFEDDEGDEDYGGGGGQGAARKQQPPSASAMALAAEVAASVGGAGTPKAPRKPKGEGGAAGPSAEAMALAADIAASVGASPGSGAAAGGGGMQPPKKPKAPRKPKAPKGEEAPVVPSAEAMALAAEIAAGVLQSGGSLVAMPKKGPKPRPASGGGGGGAKGGDEPVVPGAEAMALAAEIAAGVLQAGGSLVALPKGRPSSASGAAGGGEAGGEGGGAAGGEPKKRGPKKKQPGAEGGEEAGAPGPVGGYKFRHMMESIARQQLGVEATPEAVSAFTVEQIDVDQVRGAGCAGAALPGLVWGLPAAAERPRRPCPPALPAARSRLLEAAQPPPAPALTPRPLTLRPRSCTTSRAPRCGAGRRWSRGWRRCWRTRTSRRPGARWPRRTSRAPSRPSRPTAGAGARRRRRLRRPPRRRTCGGPRRRPSS